MPDDARFATAVAVLRARNDAFIRPLGAQPSRTLGTGNAVFLGGVHLIAANGEARPLRPGPSVWTWPAIIAALGVCFAGGIAVLVDGPAWLTLSIAAFFALILGGAAIGALVFARREARRSLVVDARSRTLDEIVNGRTVVSVPAGLIQGVRLARYEDSDGDVRFDVLVHVGFTELWIHQDGNEQDGAALVHSIADALGVTVTSRCSVR